jgi:hypothetical protein
MTFSLFTLDSKSMLFGLLLYTSSSRKPRVVTAGVMGGQNPFKVISLRKTLSALKMLLRLKNTQRRPAQSSTEVPARNRTG